jgi:hypothetical protein
MVHSSQRLAIKPRRTNSSYGLSLRFNGLSTRIYNIIYVSTKVNINIIMEVKQMHSSPA